MSNVTPVTVIGLGEMGQALAAAFLAADRPTTVWNRTAAKGDELVERGAVRPGSVSEAVAASPLIVVCLLDYGTVRDVLETAAEELNGRTVVNLTNGTPGQAGEMAAWVAERGGEYLDGGIMAVPSGIATPAAFILYSGPQQHFDTYRETLAELGEAKYVGKDIGLASLYDLALLSGVNFMFDGFHHAVAMATSSKEGSAVGFTELLVPWLTNMAAAMPAFAADIDADITGSAEPQITQGLDVQVSSLTNIVNASEEAGVRTDPLEPGMAALRELLADGYDTWSSPASVRQLKKGRQ